MTATSRERKAAARASRAKVAAIGLQITGGAVAVSGLYLLAGLAVTLLLGGLAVAALGVLREAGWL